jgi:hypothetical protein
MPTSWSSFKGSHLPIRVKLSTCELFSLLCRTHAQLMLGSRHLYAYYSPIDAVWFTYEPSIWGVSPTWHPCRVIPETFQSGVETGVSGWRVSVCMSPKSRSTKTHMSKCAYRQVTRESRRKFWQLGSFMCQLCQINSQKAKAPP